MCPCTKCRTYRKRVFQLATKPYCAERMAPGRVFGTKHRVDLALLVIFDLCPAMATLAATAQCADFLGLRPDDGLLQATKQSLSLFQRQPYRFGLKRLAWPLNLAHVHSTERHPSG